MNKKPVIKIIIITVSAINENSYHQKNLVFIKLGNQMPNRCIHIYSSILKFIIFAERKLHFGAPRISL